MTDYWEHEEYLRNSLLGHLDSHDKERQRKRNLSGSYFEDLKQKLLIEYDNKSLKDVMDCNVEKTSFGDVLKITTKEKIDLNIYDNDFRSQINHNLKLLPRVGLKTEENLKNKGYATIESLKNPPDLIITDSQLFRFVNDNKPASSRLTSFSPMFR